MKTQAQHFFPSTASLVYAAQASQCQQRLICASATDEEIAESVKYDKECFACLVERYERKIKTYVKRITGASDETVEDIVQEVFIKVYVNIDKFDRSKKFSSWIYRIAHNQAVNKFLYEKRRRMESFTYSEKGELLTIIKDNEQEPWIKMQQVNLHEQLHSALSQVSRGYQDVIVMNYFHEKTYQEIARELGRPTNTIGTMLNRGKKLLKKQLIRTGAHCEFEEIEWKWESIVENKKTK